MPQHIHLRMDKFTPEEEIKAVAKSIKTWIGQNPQKTIAVLSPSNFHGAKLVDALEKAEIPCINLLQTNTSTRNTTRVLVKILAYLVEPANQTRLLEVLDNVLPILLGKFPENKQVALTIKNLVKKCHHIEDYLWPRPNKDWLAAQIEDGLSQELSNVLSSFRQLIIRWHNATLLPVDQLVMTISQDIFFSPAEVALVYKIALLLEMFSNSHPDWQLPQLILELEQIASNSRRYLGFNQEENNFDPNNYPGKVVIATVHKAKGLEWDRVYLLSVNNYDYPSASPQDQFVGEKWFVRQRLNLPSEALAQLKRLFSDPPQYFLEEGKATLDARIEYARERVRLLYVGITRARQELVITWNTGKGGNCEPALPLTDLHTFWEWEIHDNSA
jgi:DNA helicase-2/ATP-dependent DNA helicase PcrA